jgi:hypothetical protein
MNTTSPTEAQKQAQEIWRKACSKLQAQRDEDNRLKQVWVAEAEEIAEMITEIFKCDGRKVEVSIDRSNKLIVIQNEAKDCAFSLGLKLSLTGPQLHATKDVWKPQREILDKMATDLALGNDLFSTWSGKGTYDT